jgi:hypothetical protein
MGGAKRRKGVSRKVHITGFSYNGQYRNDVLGQRAVACERSAAQQRYRINTTGKVLFYYT